MEGPVGTLGEVGRAQVRGEMRRLRWEGDVLLCSPGQGSGMSEAERRQTRSSPFIAMEEE